MCVWSYPWRCRMRKLSLTLQSSLSSYFWYRCQRTSASLNSEHCVDYLSINVLRCLRITWLYSLLVTSNTMWMTVWEYKQVNYLALCVRGSVFHPLFLLLFYSVMKIGVSQDLYGVNYVTYFQGHDKKKKVTFSKHLQSLLKTSAGTRFVCCFFHLYNRKFSFLGMQTVLPCFFLS